MHHPSQIWRLRRDEGHCGLSEIVIENDCEGPVCTIYHLDCEDLANAKLIAAAPDLQVAARKIVRAFAKAEQETRLDRGQQSGAPHFVAVERNHLEALRLALDKSLALQDLA